MIWLLYYVAYCALFLVAWIAFMRAIDSWERTSEPPPQERAEWRQAA